MIKVLLVDSDKENRKRLKDYINSSKLGFKVTKEADNGKQAFEELEKGGINLVITELRLPLLSGYHLFKKALYAYPDIKMIMYSGYEEYENMKKAYDEGLVDYLVKPIKNIELERSLNQAKQILEELSVKNQKEKKVLDQYDQMFNIFQDRFLINLIHGHLEDEEDIKRRFEYYRIKLMSGYTVLILKIDYFEKLSLVFDEKEKELFTFALVNKIQEILKKHDNGVTFINNYDEIAVILGGGLSIEEAVGFAEEIRQTAKLETATTVTIGIGKMYERPSDINISYKQAKAALRYNYYLGSNSVIHIDYVEPNNHITYQYPLKKEELLVYETVVGNRQNVIKLVGALYDSLKKCGTLPDKLVPKILLDIIVSISRYASEQNINLEELFSKHFSIKELSKKEKLDEAFGYFRDLLDHICSYIEGIRHSNDEGMFSAAKEHIGNNFGDNITLLKVAVHVNTAPEYLDKLFRQNMNMSVMEYCTRIRMDKAKELMLKTDMTDTEIAKKLGYSDLKYFEYMFIQSEGTTSYDFRSVQEGSNQSRNPYYGKMNIKKPFTK